MDDAITMQCPCCNATLGFDEAGDPCVVSEAPLPRGQYRSGNRSLVVEDADPSWREREYQHNQQQKPVGEVTGALKAPAPINTPQYIEPLTSDEAEALQTALNHDLASKGFFTTTTPE
jgi:hypothetical protein